MLNLCINQTADVDDLYLNTSLYQNVPHGFDLNLSVIAVRVAARVGVKESPFWAPCAKTYPRVTAPAVVFIVTKNSDPGLTRAWSRVTHYVEPFSVAVFL